MATSDQPGPATRVAVDLPVATVRVLEDRAQVHRRGRLQLPAGRSLLRVADVAPVIADKTLQGRIAEGEGAVADLRIRRAARIGPDEQPEAEAGHAALQRQLVDERRALQGQADRRSQELARLEVVEDQVLAELSEDVAWGRSDPAGWQAALAPVRAQARALRDELLQLRRGIDRLGQRIDDLQGLLASRVGADRVLRAELELEVVLPAAGEVVLDIAYVVACACWRPLHRATLGPDGKTLSLETFGCAWQNTGEDWAQAEITLSTWRSSLGSEPPTLADDLLQARPRQEQVVVEARDQQIETSGLGSDTRPADQLPGIDDGGEARSLQALGRPTVRSDGRPHMLPLSRFDSDAELTLVAMPERARAVVRRVVATNQGSGPLLAGPVELLAEGGRIGRTTLRYVAAGERFELGFGPDPALRVHRTLDRVEQPPSALSRWHVTTHKLRVGLSNLGEAPRTIEITERIPVSEVEQVRIKLDAGDSSPGASADSDGMVRWTVTLPAGGTAERRLAWQVDKKKDVVGV